MNKTQQQTKVTFDVYRLGRMDYLEAYRLQLELLQKRAEGIIGDSLLLMEHPPTITVGKAGKDSNILATTVELAERGVSLYFTDRGGDVTFHGPGQLVGYPIIDLRSRDKDLYQYIENLEEVLIRTLAGFGIESGRDPSHRGVWVNDGEIVAIGLRISRWVTMHGFALNVNIDTGYFSLINPCGFTDRGAISMAEVLGREVDTEAVTRDLLANFAVVFDGELRMKSPEAIGINRNRTADNETKTARVV